MDLVTAILLPLLIVPLPGQGVLRTVCKFQGFQAKPAGRLDKTPLRSSLVGSISFGAFSVWSQDDTSRCIITRLGVRLHISGSGGGSFVGTAISYTRGLLAFTSKLVFRLYMFSGLLACSMWPSHSFPWIFCLSYMGSLLLPVASIHSDHFLFSLL